MARTSQSGRRVSAGARRPVQGAPAGAAATAGANSAVPMEKGGPSMSAAQAEKRTGSSFPLLDLDDAVLVQILSALGPEPCQLAAASQTCKRLHRIAHESAWKELCYKLAPRICNDLVPLNESPPSGWQTLYKMFVWCPGLEPKMWSMEELVCEEDLDSDDEEDLKPHVQKRVPKLSATRGTKFLKPSLRGDTLYLTKFACQHYMYQEQWLCAYRGIFKDFPNSATWERVKKEKVGYYLRKTASKQTKDCPPIEKSLAFSPLSGVHPDKKKSLKTGCPYCGVRMWNIGFSREDWDLGRCLALHSGSHFVIRSGSSIENLKEDAERDEVYSEDEDCPHSTMAYVCENGHLCGAYCGELPSCYDTDSEEELEAGAKALPVVAPSESDGVQYRWNDFKDPTIAVLKNRNPVHSLPPSVRNVFKHQYNLFYHRYLGPDTAEEKSQKAKRDESSTDSGSDEPDSDQSEGEESGSEESKSEERVDDSDDQADSDEPLAVKIRKNHRH